MKNSKTKTIRWAIFLVIILLLPILLYGILFKNLSFSKNPNDWTLFADYFTGLLNPIFMLLNIVVLIKLTYEVAEYNKKDILNQMKYSALSSISLKLFSLARIILTADDKEKEIQLLRNDINSFCKVNHSLFKDIDFTTYAKRFDEKLDEFVTSQENTQILNEFDDIRNEFIKEIQNSIIIN